MLISRPWSWGGWRRSPGNPKPSAGPLRGIVRVPEDSRAFAPHTGGWMQVLGLELDNWCQAGSQSLATGPRDPRAGVRLLVGWGAGWRGQFLTQSEMSWSLCQPTRGQGWGPAGPRVGSGLPVCRPGSQALWGCGFPGSGVCSWWMETRLDANTGFLEGRAVVWPLVDGSSWVSALWWAGPCGGAAVSSGGPCATCLLLGEALFLPCWLFGLGCTSTRVYRLLSGTQSRR